MGHKNALSLQQMLLLTIYSQNILTFSANGCLFSSHKIIIKAIASYDKRKSDWLHNWGPTNLQLPDSAVRAYNSAKSSATDCGTVGIQADFLLPVS